MPKPLVIVESKTKADTISRYLGGGYTVMASFGHVRDLPRKGDLGVDVDHQFRLRYAPPEGRARQVVADLRKALTGASELYLATDEDREGEAIAWHLLEVLKPKASVPVKRLVFHEITREAITAALSRSRDLDMRLVEAQEGRRALDRLVGFEVSPVLWRRVGGARSAGRVQSVATRMVVERERERMGFRAASFWDLEGRFAARGTEFGARLVELGGRRLASGRDFDPSTGTLLDAANVLRLDEPAAQALAERLEGATFAVTAAEARPFTERPRPPFKTTTLQQEAGNKLRFSAGRTMHVAQTLYERGYITYMRTDSIKLSEQAERAARDEIHGRFGPDYVLDGPRRYEDGVKNAQEAHEAIRPAGARFRPPEEVRGELNRDERALYELIWMRTLASQMPDGRGRTLTVRLAGTSTSGEEALFRATGRAYDFLGFRMAYVDASDDAADEATETVLPPVDVGERVERVSLVPAGHTTQPPPRYTEASLVRELEARGIGRPSTYAPIIETITHERGYVWKKGNALVPSWTAFAKTQLLERYFGHLVDYDFTATMEEALDAVARGEAQAEKWLHSFYFGNGQEGLRDLVSEQHLAQIEMSEVNAIRIGDDAQGREIVVRVWANGESLHRGDEKVPLPGGLAPDELTVERAEELLERGVPGPRVLGVDPGTGEKVLVLTGRYGPFAQLGEVAEGSKAKPPRASLLASMDPETVTLDEALALLALPRVVGTGADGVEITAQNGRYGPYVKKGSETRSLDSEEQIFTITLAEAEALLAQPKLRRGQRRRPPIAELGPHPESGAPVRVLDGRYGPYVTDGATNATVPRGTYPAALTLDEAVHLLAERAARASQAPTSARRARATGGPRARASRRSATAATTRTGTTRAKAAKATTTGTKATKAKAKTGRKAGAKAATKAAATTAARKAPAMPAKATKTTTATTVSDARRTVGTSRAAGAPSSAAERTGGGS